MPPKERAVVPDAANRLNEALTGRYRILRPLGEGGMAKVYLADDLKHERKVALKVLKPELAAVVGAERFLAEIKTTANLHHPHVLPLFDSGEADAFLFYVMPYVEGETLRARIDRDKQLPVDEALAIATAVAHALQHAHDRGVIHRDIKPANILIQDGQPVVADFGIALAVGSAGAARLTETGLSVGTPYYMSPEQATGDQVVGPASDTYSLGCVLYEMLVGEPPYPGSTAQAVLGKIIQGLPVSATAIRRSIPLNVDAAIRKALEKLPADRFTSPQAFAKALADPSFRHGDDLVGAGAAGAHRWRWVAAGLAVSTLALGAALVATLARPEPPRPVERYSLVPPQSWQPTPQFAVSDDGSAIVFRGNAGGSSGQLFVRRVADLTVAPIPGTENGVWPELSPDASEVAFVELPDRDLVVAPVRGGGRRVLADSVNCCLAWSEDGHIYFTRLGTITRVPASGGTPTQIIAPVDDSGDFFYSSTDGGRVAVVTHADDAGFSIQAVRLATGERRTLFEGGSRPVVLPFGAVMFGTADARLLVAPFDADAMELTGPPAEIVGDVQIDANPIPLYDVSPSGTLVYWTGAPPTTEFELVWTTRSGQMMPVEEGWSFDAGADNRLWSLSPDETRIALRAETDLGLDIWIKELPAGPMSRLTFYEGEDRFPMWSPDGERLTFLSGRGGRDLDVWTRPADGSGTPELVFDHDVNLAEATWSPDGQWLLLRTGGAAGTAGGRDVLAIRPGLDSVPRALVATPYDEASPALSPDGRWLAYHSDETGRREVFIRSFPESDGRKVQVSNEGGRAPVWAHSGEELFYLSGDGTLQGDRAIVSARIRPGPLLAVVSRTTLFDVPDGTYFANNTTSYQVTNDDQRFLMARLARDADAGAAELVVVRNLFEELRGLLGR